MNSSTPDPMRPEPASDPDVESRTADAALPAHPDAAAPRADGVPPAPPAPPTGSWTPPPPAYLPAPARQPGAFARGFGLGAGAGLGAGVALLALGLVGSLLASIIMIGAAGAMGSSLGAKSTSLEQERTIWGAPTATKKIRAIEVSGVILNDASDGGVFSTGTYGYEIAGRLDALKAEDADAVVLLMNTPGGAMPGSRAMAEAIERYQTRTGKKLFAFVQGISASGGMYTMAGADEVVADHGSLVGSVGVISGPFLHYDDVVATSGSLLEQGVTTRGGITGGYLSAGKGKDFGSPWRPMTDAERAQWQRMLDSEYGEFVSWVSKHRNITEQKIRDELGAGIFDTKSAQAAGYIDGVMTRDEAFRHFATVAGLDPAQTRVVAPEAPPLFLQMLGAQSRVVGRAPALERVPGQPAVATASFCTSVVPMAYHGSLVAACG